MCIFSHAGLTCWQPWTDSWDVRPWPWLPYQLHTATVISTSSPPQWLMVVLIRSFQTIWSADTGKIFFGRRDEHTQPKQLQSIFTLGEGGSCNLIHICAIKLWCNMNHNLEGLGLALPHTSWEKCIHAPQSVCMWECVCVLPITPAINTRAPSVTESLGGCCTTLIGFRWSPRFLRSQQHRHTACVWEKSHRAWANKGGKKKMSDSSEVNMGRGQE